MLLQLNQISTSLDEGELAVEQRALEILKLPMSFYIKAPQLVKTSVDARHKDKVHFVGSVRFEVSDECALQLLEKHRDMTVVKKPVLPEFIPDKTLSGDRPVVVGFGPAGMFAALVLAQSGLCPLVLERGDSMENRVMAVDNYWQGKKLDSDTNVQFGEGGAGTFSDGKLTTRINDPLCAFVTAELVRHGAPQDIAVKSKPHIGTDLLRSVVVSIRKEIIRLGGEVRFLSRVDGFEVANGRISGVRVNGASTPAQAVIAAVGHSARDTFAALDNCGVLLAPKPFSVGARIEHLQSDIDRALYGDFAGHPNLPAASYQLSHREGEKAAYTFCMCPGGMVAAAASGDEQVVTNGMSYRSRSLRNANSALVVSVNSDDYGKSWRDAVAFQQKIEHAAFCAGGKGKGAPCMTVGQLLGKDSRFASAIEPSYPRGIVNADLNTVLPPQVIAFMRHSLPLLDVKLNGFANADALLTGAETRTSSPVRLQRGEDYLATGVKGLYPCGEGAGYAGGIMSAAVDGIKCAMALLQNES